MLIWLPVPILAITLTLLLRAEGRTPRDERQVKVWKPLSTVLVILVGALSFTRPSAYDITYTVLILGGLALSLAGDIFLIDRANPKAFVAGLVAFLLAHLIYIAAFLHVQSSLGLGANVAADIVTAIGLGLIAVMVYCYMRPGLGRMRVPVIAYMLVISIMVHRALAVVLVHTGSPAQAAFIAFGALLFYLSDAILGINRFRFNGQLPYGHILNLSTYYAGQLLIALSASFFS
jgi:uncharacterized membrane protein YhhN